MIKLICLTTITIIKAENKHLQNKLEDEYALSN